MTPQPPSSPAPKRSGCLIALFVVGALCGLVCLAGGIATFVAARSDTGKKIFSAIDQGVKLAEAGVNAPGAEEVRAAGCPQANVMDLNEAMKIAGAFFDGGLKDDPELDYMMVTCSAPLNFNGELPACETIAEVYAKTVASTRDFVVETKRVGEKKPECSSRFSGDGTFLKKMK